MKLSWYASAGRQSRCINSARTQLQSRWTASVWFRRVLCVASLKLAASSTWGCCTAVILAKSECLSGLQHSRSGGIQSLAESNSTQGCRDGTCHARCRKDDAFVEADPRDELVEKRSWWQRSWTDRRQGGWCSNSGPGRFIALHNIHYAKWLMGRLRWVWLWISSHLPSRPPKDSGEIEA